jgi:TPP-dependent pyruvate/acetoin dehydrogenase alpha subunit
MHALAAEMMGRRSGVCLGRGGSQHLHWGDFYASGILGGTVPGRRMALAERNAARTRVVISLPGDGTLGEAWCARA